MKAVVVESFDRAPVVREVPVPEVGPTDVLVRVQASSVNPADETIASGELQPIVGHVLPITLGRDFAGIVETVGAEVTGYRPGDVVLGNLPPWNPHVQDGTWSEYVLLPGGQFATHLPDGVPIETAGVASLVTITAIAAVEAAQLEQGQTVLVVGASGGVGVVTVQLARAAGTSVIALARAEDAEFLAELGASRTIDRDEDLAEALGDQKIDALIDLVTPDPESLNAIAAQVQREGGSSRPAAQPGTAPIASTSAPFLPRA